MEEIPGVNTQGKTMKEVRENLKEALRLIIEANRELAAKSREEVTVTKEPITVEGMRKSCQDPKNQRRFLLTFMPF